MPKILVTPTKGLYQSSGTSTTNGSISGHKVEAVATTAAKTLVAADSGKVFFINGASGHAITLPSPPPVGVSYKFIMTDTTADCTITATTALLKGEVAAEGGTGIAVAGTTITMELAATAGDVIEMVSDGTYWWCSGYTSHASGVSVA